MFTVSQMGWSGKKNGDLLRSMVAQGFEVLITVDKDLRHQQNLASSGIALIVMSAGSSRLADLMPLMPSVLAALNSIRPGDVEEVAG